MLANSEAYTVKYVPTGIEGQLVGLNSRVNPNNAGGVFSKQYGIALVKSNLIDLLTTKKGDRVMLPNFGTNLHLAVFEELDHYLKEDIKTEIYTAIATYEPRVEVLSLEIKLFDEEIKFFAGARFTEIVGLMDASKVLITLTVSLKDDATATEFINIAF